MFSSWAEALLLWLLPSLLQLCLQPRSVLPDFVLEQLLYRLLTKLVALLQTLCCCCLLLLLQLCHLLLL